MLLLSLSSTDLNFFKIIFIYKILSGTLSECQTVWTAGSDLRPDLGLNCLHWLSADDKMCC